MTMKTQTSMVDAASPPRCSDLVTRRGRRVYRVSRDEDVASTEFHATRTSRLRILNTEY